jgi:predicted dehydrogenase
MMKTAVVGLGWWGRYMVNALQGDSHLEVVAGMDVNLDAVQDLADEFDLPLFYDYQAVLDNKNVEAVILTTPHGLHEEQVLAAAAAGKQIFCEKPLSLTADSAKRMVDACQAKGLVLGIGHERRYEGALEEMKRMHDEGELGTLLNIEFNASYNLFAGTPASGWRQDPKQAPAGTMTALGVHQTDYIQTLAGPVREITARMSHRSDLFPNEDVLSVQFVFESGALGTFTSIATTPFYQRMTVLGDKAWAEVVEVANVDKPDPSLLRWRGLDTEIHTRTYQRTDTVVANLHAWADAVAGQGTYRFTPEQLLHNVEILDGIVRSMQSGKTVAIGG